MSGQPWSRDQDLAVMYLWLKYKDELKPSHPAIGILSDVMGRTEAAIWMRRGNHASQDPSYMKKGLRNAGPVTTRLWAEYEQDPARIRDDARSAYIKLTGDDV